MHDVHCDRWSDCVGRVSAGWEGAYACYYTYFAVEVVFEGGSETEGAV